MRIRARSDSGRGELQMSAMIDMVFLLLVFFIMTFQIVTPEGDFNIEPSTAAAAVTDNVGDLPLHIQLLSDESGQLRQIRMNARIIPDVKALQAEIMRMVESDPGHGEYLQAVIHCDWRLKYDYAMQVLTAIRGYRDGDGRIVDLIPNVRLDTGSRAE